MRKKMWASCYWHNCQSSLTCTFLQLCVLKWLEDEDKLYRLSTASCLSFCSPTLQVLFHFFLTAFRIQGVTRAPQQPGQSYYIVLSWSSVIMWTWIFFVFNMASSKCIFFLVRFHWIPGFTWTAPLYLIRPEWPALLPNELWRCRAAMLS